MKPGRLNDLLCHVCYLLLRNWYSCHDKQLKTQKLDPKAAADDGTRRSSGSIACGSAVVRTRKSDYDTMQFGLAIKKNLSGASLRTLL